MVGDRLQGPHQDTQTSISWTLCSVEGPPGEHQEHQLDPLAVRGEHDEHQLDTFAFLRGYRASIMSISWTLLAVRGAHHEHQLETLAAVAGVPREHHEDQLEPSALLRGYRESITSISWTLLRF